MPPLVTDFKAYIRRRTEVDEDGCWIWQGATDSKGYGSIFLKAAPTPSSHVLAFIARKGPVPAGKEIDHLCRVRKCCNPDHMEAVVHKVNMERMAEAVTHCTHGHEYTPENTYHPPNGQKVCKTCRRETDRQRQASRREYHRRYMRRYRKRLKEAQA